MMKVEEFVKILDSDFFTGVPDSQLKHLCDYLINEYGTDERHHIIAANEGNCIGIAAGYHLSTGKIPVVYLQNSGEGNIINPLSSLMSRDVYAIPCILIIGWRGEPGIHDEPQHVFQGKITTKLLQNVGVEHMVLNTNTEIADVEKQMHLWRGILKDGGQVAFVVRKGAFSSDCKIDYSNDNKLTREEVIELILERSGDDPIVSTTGKASRELFEIRERRSQDHHRDFMTVGSMGHCSSIALGIAINCPDRRIWCIDGDGSMIMHMGSMGVIGNIAPRNLIHIVINNCSHESVGGMPTSSSSMDLPMIAKGCGYKLVLTASTKQEVISSIETALTHTGPVFLEIACAIRSRPNLGRPTTTPLENKTEFMKEIHN